jgi:hypothetical protein
MSTWQIATVTGSDLTSSPKPNVLARWSIARWGEAESTVLQTSGCFDADPPPSTVTRKSS